MARRLSQTLAVTKRTRESAISNCMKYSVHLSDTTAEETRQAILAPLREYNQSQTGPNEYRGLTIEIRDEEDSIIGGLWGGSSYDGLFVQLLVVPQPLRGQGVGRKLMSLAEAEASSRGCSAVWLDTFEFRQDRSMNASATPVSASSKTTPKASRGSSCKSCSAVLKAVTANPSFKRTCLWHAA